MVDESHAVKRRIRTLSESSRSDVSSFDENASDSSIGALHSSRSNPAIRSRKQNIRELREEFEDFPELYGIRRSARSRKKPLHFKPLHQPSEFPFKSKKRNASTSNSNSSHLSESDEWEESSYVGRRTVRTRGNRVNYASAFIDGTPDASDEEHSEMSNSTNSKSYNCKSSSAGIQIRQDGCFQKPKGSLVRKPYVSVMPARSTNGFNETEVNDQPSDEDDVDDGSKLCWGDEEEADVIEEVLTHQVRRKGATGNPTTLYNARLEKDLNANFDPEREEGEVQYLIKWRNWSHIHSTWETEQSLRSSDRISPVAGLKKFYAYQSLIREKKERLHYAERDDLDAIAYEEERDEQILHDKMSVERIVAHSRDPDTSTFDYLIKWFRLDYRFCTWESGKVVRSLYESAVVDYEKRSRSTKLPNSRCEVLHSRPKFFPMSVQPDYLGNKSDCRLRDYQLEGINWITRAWTRSNSVILADEMGLGKTVQTVGFLSGLFHEYSLYGPFLLVVPLSTISSWQKEFQTWAPDMNAIIYTGDHVSRQLIREHEWSTSGSAHIRRQQSLKFNVCITTYEIILKDKSWFGQVSWAFLGVDEAHRLKNDSSQLYKVLKTFDTNSRLLITGTPLQNTMRELWALLHFAMPSMFEDWDSFQETYIVAPDDPANRLNGEAFHNLHKALRPFLLRRVKKDVEHSLPEKIEQILRVNMTKEQSSIYRLILARNYDGLMKVTKGHRASFVNIVMELKKCCNHASLIAPPSENELQRMTKEEQLKTFINGSGKASLLDKLLIRLKSKGHRVLIFSQMVRMLDIIADYLSIRGWGFQRLDGSVRGELRKQSLDHFNAEGSTDFCFLLSTRAGGLGINLATADTVIIFDSDWNPQNDLQAQARAHRIGQTKQVSVYRLVTRESVEEKIIESATRKMVLDHLVIQRMDAVGRGRKTDTAKGHLLTEILRYGAESLFKQCDEDVAELEVDIDDILDHAETRDTEINSESNPANALLSSFKVVNLDAQEDEREHMMNNGGPVKSWDEIIPDELRGQIKAEDAQRSLVELDLGPRRRRQVKTFQAGIDENPSENESDNGDEKISAHLSEKEIRSLVRAIKRFARPLERIDAIAADAELPDRSELELKDAVDTVLKGCKAAMLLSLSNQTDQAKSGTSTKGPVFQYGRVSVAAKPLLQSLEYLEILHQSLPVHSKEARMSYKLPFTPKSVNWSCLWDMSDDVRLLTGVYDHGYDNWELIKLDADLGLGSKLLPISQSERPQANHLRSRVDYLLKMLAKHRGNNHTDACSTKKRKRGENENQSSSAKVRTNSQGQVHKETNNSSSATKPKSAEFVETDDSSSDTDELDSSKPSLPSKRARKSSTKSKIKPELKTNSGKNHDLNVKDEKQTIVDSSVFTKEEEQEFRKMRGPLFLKCKEKLLPIKKYFKQLEYLEDAKEEHSKQFAKVITSIGDFIQSIVHEFEDRLVRHSWKNYLWEFVHIFSKKSTDELKHIYRSTVKRQSENKKSGNNNNNNINTSSSNQSQKPATHDHEHQTHNKHVDPINHHINHGPSNPDSYSYSQTHFSHSKRNEHSRDHYHGSSHKFNDWSGTSAGHKEYKRDRDDARFNNAFNRLPGQSEVTFSSKHYHGRDRSYSSGTFPKSKNYNSSHYTNDTDYCQSYKQDIPAPAVTQPILSHKPNYHNDSEFSTRDPRLHSTRRV